MRQRLSALGLADMSQKLDAGERLSFDDGVRLFDCPDLLALGWLANREREKRHGGRTYYNFNIRLEATNVCVASCLFCSFARLKPGDAGSYTMSLEQAWDKLRQRADQPLTEIHVVNGLHPDLPFDYYLDLLRGFIAPSLAVARPRFWLGDGNYHSRGPTFASKSDQSLRPKFGEESEL